MTTTVYIGFDGNFYICEQELDPELRFFASLKPVPDVAKYVLAHKSEFHVVPRYQGAYIWSPCIPKKN